MQNTGHLYPRKLNNYDDFQNISVRKTLVLEINAFANPKPYTLKSIRTYIAEFLHGFDKKLIAEYGLEPFEVKVMTIDKTFVEKVLCLARVSIDGDGFSTQIERKIRHFYDIHKLMATPEVKQLMGSESFANMLREVLKSDLSSPEFKKSWKVVNLLKETPLFQDIDSIFVNLKDNFENDFRHLLYDDKNVAWKDVKASFRLLSKNIPQIKVPKPNC